VRGGRGPGPRQRLKYVESLDRKAKAPSPIVPVLLSECPRASAISLPIAAAVACRSDCLDALEAADHGPVWRALARAGTAVTNGEPHCVSIRVVLDVGAKICNTNEKPWLLRKDHILRAT
jgi:hypothetical protein